MQTPLRVPPPSRQLVLLAPSVSSTPDVFPTRNVNKAKFDNLFRQMQSLRGRIYLEEGAITASQLTPEGLYDLKSDRQSWHLLLVENENRVMGCIRLLLHRNFAPVSALNVWSSTLAQCGRWGGHLRRALHSELKQAYQEGLHFAEVGGWAVAREVRCSAEAARMVLATYSLGQILGDALGISTATARNSSSSILRRLGGRSVLAGDVELPPYYDPTYNCEMEILRFDSRRPNPRYAAWVGELRSQLLAGSVISATSAQSSGNMFPFGTTPGLVQHA